MPTDPRDPHAAERHAQRERQYHEAMDEYRATDPAARALAVTNCGLCDRDGYRPNRTVCDHRDRETIGRRGMALVQTELDKIRQRKAQA